MSDRKYTSTHEWVMKEDGKAKIGLSDYAQEQLGDVVYVELPAEGDNIRKGETMGTIESVKAVSDLYAPVSGTVTKLNEELESGPERVNEDPYGAGWLLIVEPEDDSEFGSLMDEAAYQTFMEAEKEKDH